MRKLMNAAMLLSVFAVGLTTLDAKADEVSDNAPVVDDLPYKFRAGFGMDLGVPSGAAVGFVFNPFIN